MFFSFSSTRWDSSEFSGLPSVTQLPDKQLRDYALVAGGLALVLSRCSPAAVSRDFQATSQLWRSLRRQMARSRDVELPPQLLIDASHEVVQYADPATRDALRRCVLGIRHDARPASSRPRFWRAAR